MVSYTLGEDAPHLRIDLEGRVDGDSVCDGLRSLPDDINAVTAPFIATAVYPDVVYFTPDALAPLYYYAAVVGDAEPDLFILVNGGRSPAPELRAFIRRILPGGYVRIANTPSQAGRIIDAHLRQRSGSDAAEASPPPGGSLPI